MRTPEEALAEATVRLYSLHPSIKRWNGDPYELRDDPQSFHAKLAIRQARALLDNGLLAVEPEHTADNWKSRKCWLGEHKSCLGCGCSCHGYQEDQPHDSPV